MKQTSTVSADATSKLNIAIQRNKRRLQRHFPNTYTPVILFPHRPLATLLASVIVPVKNESDNIIKTLDALRLQRGADGSPLPFETYEVLLLANNCSDDTFNIAIAYRQQYPQFQLYVAEIELPKKIAHIGTARRLLMDEAFRRHGLNRHDGIILSTDGDTEVDQCWIANTLCEIATGYDAVGGRILTRQVADNCRHYYLQDTAYRTLAARVEARLDPTGNEDKNCHFQCFGASLAVRCSAYQKAGRLPVIPFLEDEAFSRALYRVDARVKKSAAVKVYTSSRLTGRVKAGLSVHLKHLGKLTRNHVTMHVESLPTLIDRWTMKQQLRECWRLRKERKPFTSCISSIATNIHISSAWLLAQMDISRYFGEFWEKIEFKMYTGAWKKRQQAIPIADAIGALRKYLRN